MSATSLGGVIMVKLLELCGVLPRLDSYGGGARNTDSSDATDVLRECADAAYALSNGLAGDSVRLCSE